MDEPKWVPKALAPVSVALRATEKVPLVDVNVAFGNSVLVKVSEPVTAGELTAQTP